MSNRGTTPADCELATGQRRRKVAATLVTSSLLSLMPGWSSSFGHELERAEAAKAHLATEVKRPAVKFSATRASMREEVTTEPEAPTANIAEDREALARPLSLARRELPPAPAITFAAPLARINVSQAIARAIPEPLSLLEPGSPKSDEYPKRSLPVLAERTRTAGPAYIDQIAPVASHSIHVPQLHPAGSAVASAEPLADQVAAMQVQLPPPPVLSESERAALLAEAPETMTLRVGEDAAGDVSFRMTENRTITVQLSGLLDILSDRYPAPEFDRLRSSPAAENYVGFDELRALGLRINYDPVYDELKLSA